MKNRETITLVTENGVQVAEVPKLVVDLYKRYVLDPNGREHEDPVQALIAQMEQAAHHELKTVEDRAEVDRILWNVGYFGIEGYVGYVGIMAAKTCQHICANCLCYHEDLDGYCDMARGLVSSDGSPNCFMTNNGNSKDFPGWNGK